MRCDLDFFNGSSLHLIYLARRLREALDLEMLLGKAEFEYYVEPGPYLGGFLFRRELTGAYFYVKAAEVERARQMMAQSGYKPCMETVLYEAKPE